MNNNKNEDLSEEEMDEVNQLAMIKKAACECYGNSMLMDPLQRSFLLSQLDSDELEDILEDYKENYENYEIW